MRLSSGEPAARAGVQRGRPARGTRVALAIQNSGKFANGAITGAMGHLYNQEATEGIAGTQSGATVDIDCSRCDEHHLPSVSASNFLEDVALLLAVPISVAERAAAAVGAARGGANATKGLQKQLESHLKKLDDYKANPDQFDNKGFLKDASPELRQKIIDGRIRNLEKQIENFRRQIEQGGGGG